MEKRRACLLRVRPHAVSQEKTGTRSHRSDRQKRPLRELARKPLPSGPGQPREVGLPKRLFTSSRSFAREPDGHLRVLHV